MMTSRPFSTWRFDISRSVALHVRDFLGTLVDEEDDEHRLRIVLRDGVGHLLEEDRLADARRRDDEPALSEPDRREEIDDARRELLGVGLEDDAPRRERGREVLEVDDARRDGRFLSVHSRDVAEAEEAVAVARIADRPLDDVASTERVAADLLLGHEDVFGAGKEVVLRGAQEAVSLADDLEASGSQNCTTVREVPADRGEDELVLAVGAELLGVGSGHHALDDLRRGPGLDVREAVLGKVGVAVGVRGRLGLKLLLVRRQRRVEERIHALFAVRPADRGVVLLPVPVEVAPAAVAELVALLAALSAAVLWLGWLRRLRLLRLGCLGLWSLSLRLLVLGFLVLAALGGDVGKYV